MRIATRQRLDRWFWSLAGAHLLAYTLIATYTQPNVPLDTVEMQHWGHQWTWGTYKHPPLPGWIAELGLSLGGESAWLIYFCGQLLIVGCLWSVWRVSRAVLPPSRAMLGVLMLEAINYYTFSSLEFRNNLCLTGFAALGTYALFAALRRGSPLAWLGAGLAWGLAFLSKYPAAFQAVPIVLWMLADREARRAWRTPGPYLALAAWLLVFGPHLVWAHRHDWITITYALERSSDGSSPWDHLVNPLRFAADQLWAVLFMLLTVLPVITARLRPALDDEAAFARRYLAVVAAGPLLLVLTLSAATGARLRTMWGMPMFTFAAPALLVWFAPRPGWWRVRRALRVGWVWAGCWALAVCCRNVVGPYVTHEAARPHFPGAALAERAEALWAAHEPGPLPLAAGEWWLAANIGFYGDSRCDVYTHADPIMAPWTSDADLRRRGGVLVWDAVIDGDRLPERLRRRFPSAVDAGVQVLRQQTGADVPPARIGLALVPPGS